MLNCEIMEYNLIEDFIALRKESGLSQTELAEKSEIKKRLLIDIENHKKSPLMSAFCKLVYHLGAELKIIRP